MHLAIATQAQLVQATFSGEIIAETSSPGFFSPGTTFSSVIVFDTSVPPQNGGQVSVGYPNAILSHNFTIGNLTYNATTLDTLVVSNNFSPVPGSLEDNFLFFSSPLSGPTVNGSNLSAVNFALDDTNATTLNSVSVPNSVLLNDFERRELTAFFRDADGISNIVDGEIQALSFQTVPEPSILTPLLALSMWAAARRRKRQP